MRQTVFDASQTFKVGRKRASKNFPQARAITHISSVTIARKRDNS